jgi:GNAT superfamily N-acetyltransferase
MDPQISLRTLTPDQTLAAAPALAEITLDCVAGGASIGFMADVTHAQVLRFWRQVATAARSDGRAVIVAERDGAVLGVVQMIPTRIDNQPHRGEVAKMLVHRSARRAGVGAALMRAAEDAARAKGRTLLVLDTVEGGAGERLYRRLGWTAVGAIPGYALFPDGAPCATVVFYKAL